MTQIMSEKLVLLLVTLLVINGQAEQTGKTFIFNNSKNFTSFDFEGKQLFGTSTVTVTSAITIISSTKTSVTCAKLVNVTGACRRRWGMLREEPIIISFNDDIDLDFITTQRLWIEPTVTAQSSNHFEPSVSTSDAISIVSSMEQEPRQVNFPFLEGVLHFIDSVASAVVNLIPPVLRPTQSTITETVWETQTVRTTSTFTDTFFVQRCTPSPFSFKLCGNRKR